MLIISRRRNESLVINGGIIVSIVEIRDDKVRLAIEAPRDVPVHRREVYDAIHRHCEAPAPAPARPPVVYICG